MKKKNPFEVRHPIFLPLWRRVLVAVLVVGWTIFELTIGSVFWAIVVGAAAVIIVRAFFINFDPEEFQHPPE